MNDVPSSSATTPERVAIIGLGYVGLPIALATVDAGHSVVGVEVDPSRFASLQRGESYVEDISDAALGAAFSSLALRVRRNGRG